MPKRALVERRPWLLGSILAALAYYILKDDNFPGLYLLAIEAASFLLLAVYALLRHHSGDARMLAAMMALSGIGVVAVELDFFTGVFVLVVGLAFGIGLFLRHRRAFLSASQKGAAVALLLLPPVIAALMARDHDAWATVTTFSLAAGGMAASAWTSSFPRYRVGTGAVFYVAASLLSIASAGPLFPSSLPALLMWPLFYLGHFLICTAVIQTLRSGLTQEA